ncbi:MAG: PAS domain S-box protein [Candidatus Lokiarchaeota archaeon]|nr:PAS domain S-box protein [Candidatus Lokiarchaeota archaeon]
MENREQNIEKAKNLSDSNITQTENLSTKMGYNEQLEALNMQYQELVGNIPGAVFQFGLADNNEISIQYISEGIYDLTGLTRDEFEGSISHLTDIVYEKDLNSFIKSLENSIENLEPWNMEFRIFTKKTREIKWLDGRSTLKFIDGRDYIWYGVLLDITEKKSAHSRLKEINEKLEQKVKERTLHLKERVKEITCLYDISKIVENEELSLEETFKRIVQRIPKSMQYSEITCSRIKYNQIEILSENFKNSDWSMSVPIQYKENTGEIEVFYKEKRPQESFGPFLEDELKLIEAIKEIIERYLEREETKKELLKKNHAIISSKSAISISNMKGIVEYVNPAFLKMWGYEDKKSVLGRSALEFWAEKEKAQMMITKILSEGNASGQMEAKRKDGTNFIANVQGKIILNEKDEKTGITASFIDITETVRAKHKLEESMKELKRSNKELEQFAYVASHDLQEPLRMVSSFTQLLQKRYYDKLDEEANEFIEYTVDGAKRMQNLINDLLTFSRVGTRGTPFKPVDMNEVLSDTLHNLKFVINETETDIIYEELPIIKADRSQIQQVFQNLISNAIKFHGKEPPKIQISSIEEESEWVFSVKDNGIGIDPQFFNKIFVIFQRLNKRGEYEGTGIGLALCKKIINRHGGEIWVDSKSGGGSTFHFSIPKRKIKKTINE